MKPPYEAPKVIADLSLDEVEHWPVQGGAKSIPLTELRAVVAQIREAAGLDTKRDGEFTNREGSK